MNYEDLDTEQKQLDFVRQAPRVQVVDVLTSCRNYREDAQDRRKPGIKGWVTKHSNSHGLCFHVEHEDGSLATWYDYDELTVIPYSFAEQLQKDIAAAPPKKQCEHSTQSMYFHTVKKQWGCNDCDDAARGKPNGSSL